MKTGTIISLVISAVIGFLILAATVPLDKATSNFASWSGPLIWVGLALIAVPIIIASTVLYKRVTKRLAQSVPAAPPADHWANRMRLEISVIANVSAGREPTESPIDKDPANSRLRELKDAIDTGSLEAEKNGSRPNVNSTVTLEDFEKFVSQANKQYWVEVVRRWQGGQAPSGDELKEELKEKRIPLLRFLEIAGRHGWPILDPGGYGGFDLIHGISESAGLGDLVLLGKKIDPQLPGMTDATRRERLPAELWQSHEINAITCFIFTNPGLVVGLVRRNKETQTKCDRGNAPALPNYKDLYLETAGLMKWLKNDADQYRGFFQETYGD